MKYLDETGIAYFWNKIKAKIPSVINNLNSTSETDALSANQGKELNNKITEAKGKLLWSNPNLWSNFNPQTINFGTSEYNCFKVFAKLSTANQLMQTQEVIAGYNGRFQLGTTARNETYWRGFSTTSDSITFEAGKNYVSSENTSNNLWIPIYVIGYKI